MSYKEPQLHPQEYWWVPAVRLSDAVDTLESSIMWAGAQGGSSARSMVYSEEFEMHM